MVVRRSRRGRHLLRDPALRHAVGVPWPRPARALDSRTTGRRGCDAMARRLTALCLALGLLTAAASGEAEARGSNCRTSGKTVIENGAVRVYKKTTTVVGLDQGEETATR